jgi:hypothetical protein
LPKRFVGLLKSPGSTCPWGDTIGRSIIKAYRSRATDRMDGSGSKNLSAATIKFELLGFFNVKWFRE